MLIIHPTKMIIAICQSCFSIRKLEQILPGLVFTKGLSLGLRVKVVAFVSSFWPKTAKTFVLGLVVFTKNLRLVLG